MTPRYRGERERERERESTAEIVCGVPNVVHVMPRPAQDESVRVLS